MKIKKVTKNTVVQQVMDQIKNSIANGELKPGDKIPTETQLSEQFGTGRSTIREAIKIFEFLGIFDSQTRTGTYVCDYTNISTEALTWSILLGKNELFELIDLRSIIEQRSLMLVLEKAEEDPSFFTALLSDLEASLRVMESAVNGDSMDDLITADYDFHGTIIDASGNNVYVHIYQTLESFMYEEIKKTNRKPESRSRIVDDHQKIVETIREKNLDRILAVYRDHISNTIQQLTSME